VRGKLFQQLARETVTIRHGVDDVAVPYRQNGSFLLGDGVGGAGFHWNGMHYRITAGRAEDCAATTSNATARSSSPRA
jgi:hypothetical protein